MTDIFRECRERVSALDAARHYGLEINRYGKACCPFHNEKTPSCSFKGGRFKCFGCGVGGSSVDYTARLFGIAPIDAVRRLNADFSLGLPLNNREPSEAERQEAKRRQELTELHTWFESWREGMIVNLNHCIREANLALKECRELTDAEALAVQQAAYFEYLIELLSSGTAAEQMEIYRGREALQSRIDKILQNTPTKSGVA